MTEQLRAHCAQQISEMKQSVGCHQELMEALKKTYPEQVDACTPADTGTGIHRAVTLSPSYLTQSVCGCLQVALNHAYVETLSSAWSALEDNEGAGQPGGGGRVGECPINTSLVLLAFWKTLGLILKSAS